MLSRWAAAAAWSSVTASADGRDGEVCARAALGSRDLGDSHEAHLLFPYSARFFHGRQQMITLADRRDGPHPIFDLRFSGDRRR
ncbi:hypothetical protein GCM10009664_66220 [Kitasatospora gansuensis]